nr:helix-turn-helix transcriptional regulator [Aestuariicella albida]
MQSKGLDAAFVAREVGISPVYLKQIEAGEREPSEPILRNIARALGVDVKELSGS